MEYAERRVARIARKRERSSMLARDGRARLSKVERLREMIPVGQPILVGHHSQPRHEKDIERIEDGTRKGLGELREAARLERQADAAENSTAVSSDDPEALSKLRVKLEEEEKSHARMLAANQIIRAAARRKADATPELLKLGYTSERCAELLNGDFAGRIGHPPYALTNSGAEIRRLKGRIEQLERRAAQPPPAPIETNGARIVEEDNRVRIFFPDKPPEAVRDYLKRNGWRWSPSVGAWQQYVSANARYVAGQAVAMLAGGGAS